jgi:hypothetical protein
VERSQPLQTSSSHHNGSRRNVNFNGHRQFEISPSSNTPLPSVEFVNKNLVVSFGTQVPQITKEEIGKALAACASVEFIRNRRFRPKPTSEIAEKIIDINNRISDVGNLRTVGIRAIKDSAVVADVIKALLELNMRPSWIKCDKIHQSSGNVYVIFNSAALAAQFANFQEIEINNKQYELFRPRTTNNYLSMSQHEHGALIWEKNDKTEHIVIVTKGTRHAIRQMTQPKAESPAEGVEEVSQPLTTTAPQPIASPESQLASESNDIKESHFRVRRPASPTGRRGPQMNARFEIQHQ